MNENEPNRIFLAAIDEIAPNRIRPKDSIGMGEWDFRHPKTMPVVAECLANMFLDHFESLVAEIALREYGGRVILTPKTYANGANVILVGDSVNVLILCKRAKHDQLDSKLSPLEIYNARPFYERFTRVQFGKLFLVSNTKSYDRQIQETARKLGVELMDEEYIVQRARQYGITWQDVFRRNGKPRFSL